VAPGVLHFPEEDSMADIQLSSQLFQEIQQAVLKQEPQADQVIVIQYLAAVMGYMLGSQKGVPDAERDALMEELCDFAHHVYQDVVEQQRQAQQQPQTRPPSGQAFGYWLPPK
jgi:hypothetical protein